MSAPLRKDLVHCIGRAMLRLFLVPLPDPFSCWASDCTFHLEPLDFMPGPRSWDDVAGCWRREDGVAKKLCLQCSPKMGQPEGCMRKLGSSKCRAPLSSWHKASCPMPCASSIKELDSCLNPVFSYNLRAGPFSASTASIASLQCHPLCASIQRIVPTPRPWYSASTFRCSTISVSGQSPVQQMYPAISLLLLLIAANVNALGFFLAARFVATVSRYPAESSFRTPTALHHWRGVTVGYHAEPTKSSLFARVPDPMSCTANPT